MSADGGGGRGYTQQGNYEYFDPGVQRLNTGALVKIISMLDKQDLESLLATFFSSYAVIEDTKLYAKSLTLAEGPLRAMQGMLGEALQHHLVSFLAITPSHLRLESVQHDFAEIVLRMTNITSLDLSLCHYYFTDAGVKRIAQLTDVGLEKVCNFKQLTTLILGPAYFASRFVEYGELPGLTKAGLQHLHKLTHLRKLGLGDWRSMTKADFECITHLAGLTHLDLSDCRQIEDDWFLNIGRLQTLTSVNLRGCIKLTYTSLCHLPEHLTSLNIENLKDDGDLNEIGRFKQLTHLRIQCESFITQDILWRIGLLTELTSLSILAHYAGFDSAGLVHITNLTKLTSLTFQSTEDNALTDAGMAHICELHNLTSLELNECHLSNMALQYLAKLTELRSLNLSSSCYGGDLGALIALPYLTTLSLEHSGITDETLIQIGQCKHLTSLNLYGCESITSNGILELIVKLKKLTKLNVVDCENIAEECVEAIQAFRGPQGVIELGFINEAPNSIRWF